MNNRQQKMDAGFLWADWTKSAMDFWQNTASTWQDMLTASTGREKRRMEDFGTQSFGAFNSMWSNMFNSEAIQEMMKTGSFNDLATKGAQSLVNGCTSFQEMMKNLGTKTASDKDYFFTKAQQEVFQSWIDFHEREIQPLLNMPQVGLTRIYQEKLNQLFDKFNLYQAAVAEFQYMLWLPMETSLREMQEKIDLGQKEGKSDKSADFKNYYAQWIKSLEGHYQKLFRSPEWNQTLSRLVDQSSDFKMSRNEIITDFMQFLPVPTNKDMDEVYKELYTLKKMVKQLIKKNKQQESITR